MGQPSSANFIRHSHRFLSCYQLWYCYLHTASAHHSPVWSQVGVLDLTDFWGRRKYDDAQWWECTMLGTHNSENALWPWQIQQHMLVSTCRAGQSNEWTNSISILPCYDSLDWILAGQRLIVISVIFNSTVHVACSLPPAGKKGHPGELLCTAGERVPVQMKWLFSSTPLHFSNASKMTPQARAKAVWQQSCWEVLNMCLYTFFFLICVGS